MNRPAVPGIRVRGQPNLQRVSGVGIRLLVRKAGAMAEPTKYIWCQHCYTGWTTKEDKQVLELRHGLAQAFATPTRVGREGHVGCPVATDKPSQGTWVLPTSRLGAGSKSPDEHN